MKPSPLPRSGGTFRCDGGVLVREDAPEAAPVADTVDAVDSDAEASAADQANERPPSAARQRAAPPPAKKPNRAAPARKR